MSQRYGSAAQLLRRVALWNASVIGGMGILGAVVAWARDHEDVAVAILVAASVVVVMNAASALIDVGRLGAGAGAGFVAKMVVVMASVFAVDAWIGVERKAFLLAVVAGIVISLGIDSAVILRQPGPDFDIPENGHN